MAPDDFTSPRLGLMVLRQDDGLAVSLTDFRQLGLLGRCALAPQVLAKLRGTAGDLPTDAGQVCERGRELFERLLPDPVRACLRGSAGGSLALQIDPTLVDLPWELAFDGEAFLGEKFNLSRQVLAAPIGAAPQPVPRRGRLRVALLRSDPSSHRLEQRLAALDGLDLRVLDLATADREAVLAALADCDCAHYAGTVDGGETTPGACRWWRGAPALDTGDLRALPTPPLLLISQHLAGAGPPPASRPNAAFAAAACRHGLNVVTCEAPATGAEPVEFLEQLFRGLQSGLPVARSLRDARELAHRRRGIVEIARMRAECYGDDQAAVVDARQLMHGGDDLRQLTIMSYDLVESTRLMVEIGAERYSDLLLEYHRVAGRILRAHGGRHDDPQGDDGSMCYFGFPTALEDAAVRALRAALDLVDAVHAIGLEVRVGVCTGGVVIRDGQPVGPAVHLAARLQAAAAPGRIVVGRTTRQIAAHAFQFEPREGPVDLKGFDQAEALFEVRGRAIGPGADTLRPRLTPLVGRERELQTLQTHWQATCGGSLRLLRLVGEAGIGKSRLVREFKRTLSDQGIEAFECRCAPEHVSSAFRPLVEALRSLLRTRDADPPEHVHERLRRLVERAGGGADEATALLADLLSLAPAPEMPSDRKRQLTMTLLIALGLETVRHTPACLIVEDVHWVDPSTAEFLNRFAQAAQERPLMILVTGRNEPGRWHPRVPVVELELHGLAPEMARSMVVAAGGPARLPTEVVHLIAARADGVPLFIEESTRMAVELGADRIVASAMSALPVPSTLLDLLTARLDRLGSSKSVAQVAGVIGREFPQRLLAAVLEHRDSPLPLADAPARLAELVHSGLMVARREGAEPRYAFRHALMRDAAYRSILERQRVQLHRVVADVIGAQFRDLAAEQPEMLAYHFTEAGMEDEALAGWESAARHAASRSAHAESISHVLSALGVLARRARSDERDRIELRLQLLLAARLIATEGYGARRVESAYQRAAELAEALDDEVATMKVLLGLEGYHFMRGDFASAKAHASRAQARLSGASAIFRVQVQWAHANVHMHEGHMAEAVRQMDACRAEYDRMAHHPGAVQDPGVMCLCYSAWSMWQLGCPDQALQRVAEVVERAERLRHKFSLGEAYGFRAAVRHFRGEDQEALASAERAVAVCEESGFVVWLAHARVMRGRVRAGLGDTEAGIEEMRQGYEAWAATGAVVTTPFYLAMRAEGLALASRLDEGLTLLAQAQEIVDRTGERYYEAEVRRLAGRLGWAVAERDGLDRRAEAEAAFWRAHECAQQRDLRSLTLRAALCLADLYRSDGRPAQAEAVLRPAYEAIREGRQTRDLAMARARLDTTARQAAG